MKQAPTQGDGNGSALMQRLRASHRHLSGGRRQLIDGILQNIDETVFLSSRELAARFKTDPATVVRTAQALGYGQFADFSRELREHFMTRVNPYRVLAAEASDDRGPDFHVRRSLNGDLQNLQQVQGALDPAVITAVGQRLRRCRHILVVANDIEHNFAAFLAYALSAIGMTAIAPEGEGLTLQRQRALTAEDGLIAITFRRCLRVPVEALQEARARGAFTLAITDSDTTPAARSAERALLAPIEGESFAASYVAPMAVINALLVACSHADARRSLEFLRPTEAEYGVGLRWYQEPVTPRRGARSRAARARRKES
jgi:RpiR family transcriptional regulator, carbohydrate utilization regulator